MQFRRHLPLGSAARLRALALLAVVAVAGLAWALLWFSHQHELATRQGARQRIVNMAYAAVQWTYSRHPRASALDEQARKQALSALQALRHDDEALVGTYRRLLATTLGAMAVMALLMFGLIEMALRGNRATTPSGLVQSTSVPEARHQGRPAGGGNAPDAPMTRDTGTDTDPDADADSLTQTVSRFRVAGAF